MGDPQRIVIVFEENHGSVAGQIEIAMMLNRLYERYGLRHIGLEGYFATEGKLDTEWFRDTKRFVALQPIREREDIIAQLLEEGEINSSELMALVYDDVEVVGIENETEYLVEPPDQDATTIYLVQIAVKGMTQEELGQVTTLLDSKKVEEAINLAVGTDEWTKEKYVKLQDTTHPPSCEEFIQIAGEIEARASQVNAAIRDEDRNNLRELRLFFEMCSQRSKTMVKHTLELLQQHPVAPVAITVGAAHTQKVVELLRAKGVSLAVIRGNALAENRENGDLHIDAYLRKTLSQSIDPAGKLGALLDGRKKPRPVVNELWYQSKSSLYYLASYLAHAVANNELDAALSKVSELQLKGVILDLQSVRTDGGDLIFHATATDKEGKPVEVWARTRVDAREVEKLLEQRLSEALQHVQNKDAPDNSKSEPTPSGPQLTAVDSETVAKFASSNEEISQLTLDK